MAKPQNKPWSKGYIPQPGRVRDPAWTAPKTPAGWHRSERTDRVEFQDDLFGPNYRIIGLAGKPWRVYEAASNEYHDEFAARYIEVFKTASFDVCLTWVTMEKANAPEPKRWAGMDYSGGRQTNKAAYYRSAYRTKNQTDIYAALLGAEMKSMLRESSAAVRGTETHEALAKYCAADVDMTKAWESIRGLEITTVVIDELVKVPHG